MKLTLFFFFVFFFIARVIVYYDDSDDDTEDFQLRPKKIVKMMKGMKVSFAMCCFCCYYIILMSYTHPRLFNLNSILESRIWFNFVCRG